MDLMEIGTKMLLSKVGAGSAGNSTAMSALSGLMGDSKGGTGLGDIVSKMQGGDMASIASSWLGSGSNSPINADQLRGLFGKDKISQFASQLGTDEDSALSGLCMIDQGSPDGSLLDLLGGVGGLAKMAGKFLK